MVAPSAPIQSDSTSNDVKSKCAITSQLLQKNNYHNLDVLYNLNKHHNNNLNNSNNLFGVLAPRSDSTSTATKSILENRLLSQSSKIESQSPPQLVAMDESNFHPSTSSLTMPPEMRKVEPLKINLLHREPIRTVIKIPSTATPTAPSSPKITIKPLAIPKITIKSVLNPSPLTTVSPTSSSSSFTSDSSAETAEIMKVPKLHIKHGSNHCDPSEPQTVPKLTIRGVASPCVNNVDAIPKLTIKMENHDNNFHHHFGGNANEVVPKMTIKTGTNHHASPATSTLSKEGVKMKIKLPEPQIPKLTIKTSDHEAHFVSSTSNSYSPASARMESPIPKLTIKATNLTSVRILFILICFGYILF